ncbi:ATP-binding protein [Janthinobacterium sp. LB3P118]|uniref:ATP-binding protein n=1 Tax=Janthinobacterium sp. LB3P118 TaxID=3424195 RepID=UPI003F25960C
MLVGLDRNTDRPPGRQPRQGHRRQRGQALQADIFDKCSQADDTPSRAHGGAGMGLAIARQLATLMGGTASAMTDRRRKIDHTITCIFVR